MPITLDQIKTAATIANQVYTKSEEMTLSDGVNKLVNEAALNINSARDFITGYSKMMRGEVYKRALSASTIDHFLTIIREGHSDESFLNAIAAVNKHIKYYEEQKRKVNKSVTLHKLRAVVEQHSAENVPTEFDKITQEFYAGVQKSLNDTHENRSLRLLIAPKVPTKIKVTTTVFRRNYDVVAAVLKRAKGKCELCKAAAPFIKSADEQPYLEVHHRKPLSQGGEDTVENATALCPNCHRYCHFGL